MNPIDRETLAVWVEQLQDGSISTDEMQLLERAIMDQPEACELYLDLMHQNAHLQLERVHLSATTTGEVSRAEKASPRRLSKGGGRRWLAALAALAASLMFIVWWTTSSMDTSPVLAQIIDSSDAEYGECTLPTAVGSELVFGRLKIERGLTTIRFTSGAELTLESPAELEIQSPMRGRLLSGTALIQVPESAHGFTLTTPNAVAIDHGTAFAVSVDQASQSSSIEVLDGEVEVQHLGSHANRRLKQTQRVVASAEGLSDSTANIDEPDLSGIDPAGKARTDSSPARLLRITTADGRGRDASVSKGRSDDVLENSRNELVLVKNPADGYERFGRKGYFAFDLSSLNGNNISSATFALTLQPSGLGFASNVGLCEFIVYGLTDETHDEWIPERLTWKTAPGGGAGAGTIPPEQATELGRFLVPRGKQHGQVSIEGPKLADFLNSDTNGLVTLIVVRKTKELEPGGLVHGFANRSNSVSAPPALLLETQEPDTANAPAEANSLGR